MMLSQTMISNMLPDDQQPRPQSTPNQTLHKLEISAEWPHFRCCPKPAVMSHLNLAHMPVDAGGV